MKTIGLIGGVSWESTLDYYRIINETVKERLGGLHSARLLMYSFDFDGMEKLLRAEDWEGLTVLITEAARVLKSAGADFLVICSNTFNNTAEAVSREADIPVLHIADAAAGAIKGKGMKTVGLLGTKYVMEGDFYKKRLLELHGIDVIVPGEKERELINNVIFEEICLGVLKQSSREKFKEIIKELCEKGAEGVVLGCTEIPILVKQEDVDVTVFDTTAVHAISAVEEALKG